MSSPNIISKEADNENEPGEIESPNPEEADAEDQPIRKENKGPGANKKVDVVKGNLRKASSFHIAQFLILCEPCACGAKLQRYQIYNAKGRPYLRVIDVTDCMTRCCFGQCYRELRCTDASEQREFVVMTQNCAPCSRSIQVAYPPGNYIGQVVFSTFFPVYYTYEIYDKSGNNILHAISPCCCAVGIAVGCFQNVDFAIYDADMNVIGVMTKKVRSVLLEMLTDLDNFTAKFPANLPLTHKVLLISCGILIDHTLFSRRR